MAEEIKWVIIPQRVFTPTDDTLYKVGCYKTIGDLVNFIGFRIGNGIVKEYSYASRNESLPEDAIIIGEAFFQHLKKCLRNLYIQVQNFITYSPVDESSQVFCVLRNDSLCLINLNPNSDWRSYQLLKKEIPQILHFSHAYLFVINDVDKKYINEDIFYSIMDMIMVRIKEIWTSIDLYIKKQ